MEAVVVLLSPIVQFARKWWLLIVIGFVSLAALYVVLTYSLVRIPELPNNTAATLEENSNTSSVSTKKLRSGLNMVRRQPARIVFIKQGEFVEQSAHNVIPRLLSITTVKPSLSPQKQIQKTISFTEGCTFGTPADLLQGNGYSYNCDGGNTIIKKHSFNEESGPVKASLVSSNSGVQILPSSPYPYKDGFIGLIDKGTDTQLVYSRLQGNTVVNQVLIDSTGLTLDEVDRQSRLNTTRSYIANSGSESDGFVFIQREKKELMFFKDALTKPVRYSYADDLPEENMQISIALAEDTLTLFAASVEDPVNAQEHARPVITRSLLFQYTLSKKNTVSKQEIKIKKPSHAPSALFAVSKNSFGFLDLEDEGSMSLYMVNNDRSEQTELFYKTGHQFTYNKELYFVDQSQNLFAYNPNSRSSRLVTGTSGLSVSRIYVYNNIILINAVSNKQPRFTNRQSVNTMTFILSSQERKKSVVDILPYATEFLPISYSDYFGNTLYFIPQLASQSATGGSGGVDQNEAATVRNSIRNQLVKDGVNLNTYKLVVSGLN